MPELKNRIENANIIPDYNVFEKHIFESEFDKMKNDHDYNISINLALKSVKLDNKKFTNYVSSFAAESYKSLKNIYEKYKSGTNILELLSIDDESMNNTNKKGRLNSIISETIGESVEIIESSILIKYSKLDNHNRKTKLRIYVRKVDDSNLDICLIDLYHLAIPSKHKGKTAENIMQSTYNKNKSNHVCISNIMK